MYLCCDCFVVGFDIYWGEGFCKLVWLWFLCVVWCVVKCEFFLEMVYWWLICFYFCWKFFVIGFKGDEDEKLVFDIDGSFGI